MDESLHHQSGQTGAGRSGTGQNIGRGLEHARRSVLAVFAFSLLAGLGGGCSREQAPPPPPGRPAFDVALLTSGSINDAGWNALGYEGLKRIRDELGAETTHIEAIDSAAQTEAFGSLGARGFDLVFGHGFEFQDAALAAAPRFPGTTFVIVSGSRTTSNVAPVVFEVDQAAYLLGMLAAMESKTGKAGLVGETQQPPVASTFLAFRKGARSVDPDFEIYETYTESSDPERARMATLALADQGCDFLMHRTGTGARGVIEACRERDLRCFGTSRNQNDLAAEVMVASIVVDVPEAFLGIGRLVKGGKFSAKVYSYGLDDGIVSIAWNEKHRLSLPPDTMTRLDETERQMREREFEMPGH